MIVTTELPQRYQYRVEGLEPGGYTFRLKQIDFDGTFEFTPEVETAVALTAAFLMTSPYPNPFNPQSQFSLMVKRKQEVEVSVYDVVGRRVRMLFEGTMGAEQARVFVFEAGDLPSGLYLIDARGEVFVKTHKVMLLK